MLNSDRLNTRLERLERRIREVRVNIWKKRLVDHSRKSSDDSDTDSFSSGQITYDDVNIGLIKKGAKQNWDWLNQTTRKQMYEAEEKCHHFDTEEKEKINTTDHTDETKGCDDKMSTGTLFRDNSQDDNCCVRYDNGTGPLWTAYRWSPYVSAGLEELCQLIADVDGGLG